MSVSTAPAPSETMRPPGAPHPLDLLAAAVTLAVLAAAGALVAVHRIPGWGVETDLIGAFLPEARHLLAGEPYTYPYHPPGYAAILALGMALGGDGFLVARLVSAGSTAVLVATTYLLARDLYDRRVALAAMLFTAAAVLPWSFIGSTDVPATALILLAFAAALRARGPWGLVATGAVAGAAYLLRSHGLTTLAGAGLYLLFLTPAPLGPRLRRALWIGAGFLVAIAPAHVYSQATTGRLFFESAYAQVGRSFGDTSVTFDDPQASAVTGAGEVGQLATRAPVRFLRKWAANSLYWHPRQLPVRALGVPAAIFLGAGMLVALGRLDRRRAGLLLMFAVAYAPVGLMDFLLRYYVFVYPLLALFVALVLAGPTLIEPLARRLPLGVVQTGLVVVVGGLTLLDRSEAVARQLATEPVELLPAAAWLRAHAHPEDRVFMAKPQLAWLAGLPGEQIESTSGPEIVADARRLGVRYVGFVPEETRFWPPVGALRNPDSAPAGLRPVFRDSANSVVLYELTP